MSKRHLAFVLAVGLAPGCGCSEDLPAGGDDLAAAPDLATPDLSPASDLARPAKIESPIEHVIVIVKENHTFDNYFGSFPGAEGTTLAQTSTGPVAVGRPPLQLLRDLCHEHQCALDDWASGTNAHWDLGDTRNASDGLAWAQYQEQDIPNYWQYARSFGLADHFFSSMLGPSFPGHMFFLAAQTGWAQGNPSVALPWGCDAPSNSRIEVLKDGSCTVEEVFPCFKFPTLPEVLPPDVSWKFYGSKLPPLVGQPWSMFDAVDQVRNTGLWQEHVVDEGEFVKDVADGKLANVVWLVNQDQNSEHPPFNICSGENWTVDRINAVMNSAYWEKTVIFIAWDDFGGWYDHVPPPKQYGCDATRPYGLGFRLPFIIVSPYAKPGFIMKSVAHQASVPKFIERIFGLPSLASLDSAAQDGPDTNDLTEAFDFQQSPIAPLVLSTRNCVGQR